MLGGETHEGVEGAAAAESQARARVVANVAALNEASPGSAELDAQSVLRIRTRTQDPDVLLASSIASAVVLIAWVMLPTRTDPWLVAVTWIGSLFVILGHAAIGFRTEIRMDDRHLTVTTWRRVEHRGVHHVRVITPREGPPRLRLSKASGDGDIHLRPFARQEQRLAAVMNTYLVWRAGHEKSEEPSRRHDLE